MKIDGRVIVLNKTDDRVWLTDQRFFLIKQFPEKVPKGFSIWRIAKYSEADQVVIIKRERQNCRGANDFAISSEVNSEALNLLLIKQFILQQ